MLTNVFSAMVKNSFKESFYNEKKKKKPNVLTVFFISYKKWYQNLFKIDC